MKKCFLILFLFFIGVVFGQTIDHIQFDYDASGNQIKRYVVDINPGKSINETPKDIESLTDNDLINSDIYNDIQYYPNPVKEALYVRWKNVNDDYVATIELYAMSGQLMKSYSNLKNTDNTTIEFLPYPQGFYTVVLIYSNGENKTLKIVKR